MGMYDMFFGADTGSEQRLQVQLKAGRCLLQGYEVGSSVVEDYSDGVYHAPDGVVVIHRGKVLSVTETMPSCVPAGMKHYTKWGGFFDPETEKLEDFHPFKDL